VQMPEMDGLEATAAIRKAEEATGTHVPIIALTAHAMKGDREACMAAGTDGYLSKPVNVTELFELIEDLTGSTAIASPESIESPELIVITPLEEPAFNMQDVLARVEGDRSLMIELAQVFRAEIPGALAQIRHCVAMGDFAGLERAAHGFKGACGNFGAGGAVRAAHALEHMGHLASREDVDARVADLERETLGLDEALLSMTEEAVG